MNNYIFKISQLQKYKDFLLRVKKSKHAIILNSEDTILTDALAKLVAMNFECEYNETCFICNSCQKIVDDNALDVLHFGIDKNIVVEDSEKIVEESHVVPYEFKNKYFVLHSFEKSTQQAQNKLLKVIEEPQAYDKFIILTNNLDAVLQTIKSRCEVFDVPRFSTEELKQIFDFDIGSGKKVSFGAEYSAGNLTKLSAIYNDEDFAEIYLLCTKIVANLKSSADILEYSSKICKYKDKIAVLLEILSLLYRDLLVIKSGELNLVQNKQQINMLMVLSNGISNLAIINIIKEIQSIKEKLKYNASLNGVVDNLLLKTLEIKHLCK